MRVATDRDSMEGESSAKLVVDYREHGVISALQTLGVEFKTDNLPVADFEIGGGTPLLIERKTPSDLMASLTDKRYRQQKERLKLRSEEGAKVLFLLEGKQFQTPTKMEPRIRAAFLSMSLARWCGLVVTASEMESAQYIGAVLQTLQRWEADPKIARGPVLQSTSKVSKKDCRTPQDSAMAALTCIRGVSSEKAAAVMQNVGSLADVCSADEKVIADITCGVKRRRLGVELAKRIKDVLHASTTTTNEE